LSDATALDVWALDHLRELFQNATQDQNLAKELHRSKVVFFLHLLGLDTTGHSYRPHSRVRDWNIPGFILPVETVMQEYMHNIEVVDEIVRQTEDLVNNFYQDTETAFVFTADHGMSVIGNHGDGRK
jgi:GPI ethanolamine phosphate transferase 1